MNGAATIRAYNVQVMNYHLKCQRKVCDSRKSSFPGYFCSSLGIIAGREPANPLPDHLCKQVVIGSIGNHREYHRVQCSFACSARQGDLVAGTGRIVHLLRHVHFTGIFIAFRFFLHEIKRKMEF